MAAAAPAFPAPSGTPQTSVTSPRAPPGPCQRPITSSLRSIFQSGFWSAVSSVKSATARKSLASAEPSSSSGRANETNPKNSRPSPAGAVAGTYVRPPYERSGYHSISPGWVLLGRLVDSRASGEERLRQPIPPASVGLELVRAAPQ